MQTLSATATISGMAIAGIETALFTAILMIGGAFIDISATAGAVLTAAFIVSAVISALSIMLLRGWGVME